MRFTTETRVGLFVLGALAVFFYMTIHIGVFRLGRNHYKHQKVFFSNASGLEKKAQVKIAGVVVGWVDNITLIQDHTYQAQADLMINKDYILYADARALVRQDGLLGTKYLEVIPGDPDLPELCPDQFLQGPLKQQASMDEILTSVGTIAHNVEMVSASFKDAFAGSNGSQTIRNTLDTFQQAAQKIADLSATIDRTLSNNEDNINLIIQNFRDALGEIKDKVPQVSADIHNVAIKLESALDTDFKNIATRVESATGALESAATQARDGFKNISSVAEKIDEGRGLLGKLINDDESYRDVRMAVTGLKNYFAKLDTLNIVLDSHGEFMYGLAEHVPFQDTKGYFDVRIHPNDDHFYILQLASAQKGNLSRKIMDRLWFDEVGRPLEPSVLIAQGVFLPELVGNVSTTYRELDAWRIGAQVGKIYKDVAFRFGLFEGFVGVGVDFEIPFCTDKFRWVTSLEMFDFRGRDRFEDNRPHLKWINRVFLFRNIYAAFGADDFVSRLNANGFFGFGLRFSDDDLKYIAGKIGLAGII